MRFASISLHFDYTYYVFNGSCCGNNAISDNVHIEILYAWRKLITHITLQYFDQNKHFMHHKIALIWSFILTFKHLTFVGLTFTNLSTKSLRSDISFSIYALLILLNIG